ncbi:MAG: hypothetical protein CMK07_06505 [Ponticaulis sp.]|nr:hypothetical protein [Ponticaulis sp.]
MLFRIVLPTAFALSTDAFVVAIAKGVQARTRSPTAALRIGLLFGGFEAGMCALGWSLAFLLADLIRTVDHWVALVLLVIVGGKMIWEVVSGDDGEEEEEPTDRKSPLLWLLTAMGTSIDAAAVGVALAFSSVPILLAAPIIGLTSGGMSAMGYMIAPMIGLRFGKTAEVIGGLVLIAIGCFIFWSHTFGGHG